MKSPATSTHLTGLTHINPKWAWHHDVLLELRQNLLSAAGGAAEKQPSRSHEHASSHEVVLEELVPPETRLAEVDAALARIREGRYGVCELTREPIATARLRAMPWTRYAQPAFARSHPRAASPIRIVPFPS